MARKRKTNGEVVAELLARIAADDAANPPSEESKEFDCYLHLLSRSSRGDAEASAELDRYPPGKLAEYADKVDAGCDLIQQMMKEVVLKN